MEEIKEIKIDKISVNDIRSHLNNRITKTQKTAKNFDEGDHWQKGAGFLPFAFMSPLDKAQNQLRIEEAFVSENLISKLISNEQNGVLGREPDFNIVDTNNADNNNSKIIAEFYTAIVKYLADNKIHKLIKAANRIGSTQENCVVRAFIPKGFLINGKLAATKDLSEAMGFLKFEILTADQAGVFLEKNSFTKYGLYLSETDDGKIQAELTFVDAGNQTRVRVLTESQYEALAEKTLPILSVYMPEKTAEIEEADGTDLGGELFYFEFSRKALIDKSMISNQKAVNLNHTMKNRNTFQHGSRDFFALNAQQPVEEKIVNGKIEYVPSEVRLGGANVNFLNGAPIYDGIGEARRIVGYANADFKTIEPSDPQVFITGGESEAAAMYRQACQEHLAISESAVVSGKSKKESRDAFAKNLIDLKGNIDPLGMWIVKVLAYFAADLTGRIEQIKNWRFVFDCIVDAGAVDTEEVYQDREDVVQGFMSLATYHTRRGIEDSQAENDRLQQSEFYKLSLNKKRLELLQTAQNSNIETKSALKLAGFSEDETEEIIFSNAG